MEESEESWGGILVRNMEEEPWGGTWGRNLEEDSGGGFWGRALGEESWGVIFYMCNDESDKNSDEFLGKES